MTSIRGVAGITSYSREGSIVVHLTFHWGQDMDFAYLDVKKNAGILEGNEHVTKIDVYRFDPNAAALMTLAFCPRPAVDGTAGTIDRVQVTSLVENSLRARFETVEGVAYVKTNGGTRLEVTVLVDDDAMTQLKLTPDKLIQAIREHSISATGGTVIEAGEKMTLKFISRFRTVGEIGRCVVGMVEDHPIRLDDVSQVQIARSEDEVVVRQNGIETVALDVFREPDANAVLTARRVRRTVAELNRRGDYGIRIAVDRSREVEQALAEVVRSALVGMGLATVVLWVFLRNVLATLVAAAAIPVSIVATFSLMYFQRLSLNIMSLGGLALGAGMLVDNGIVVIENIFRQRGEARSPREAAVVGTREVALAITAATLTTIVVFVPLVYVHGVAGILFRDQALTVVYSLSMSLVVALVLIPMLAARLAPKRATGPGLLNRAYGVFLAASLKVRWLLLAVFVALMFATWQYGRGIPTRFFPESVNGRLSLLLDLPLGTSLDRTQRVVSRLERPLLSLRYRDAELAPLLQVYEEWQHTQDLERFLAQAARALARMEARLSDAGKGTENTAGARLLARLDRVIFPEEWDGRMTELLESKDAARARKRLMKRVADALEPFIVLQSVHTVVGVDPDSIRIAGERIYGPHTAHMEIVVNPRLLREIAAADVIALLRSEAANVPELTCTFESRNEFLQDLLGKDRGDVVVEVHAEDLDALRSSADGVAEAFRDTAGLTNVRTSFALGEETLVLEPDHDALLRGKFSVDDLTKQIKAYLRGDRSDQIKLPQGEMGILVKSPRADREGLAGLFDLQVVSSEGRREKLANLVTVRRDRAMREIVRVNQERTLLVMADLDDAPYHEAVAAVRRKLDALAWPPRATWNPSGEEVQRRESFARLTFALLIAVVLVYMVIASILESVVHPLTIMLSVPLALTGVVAAFRLTGVSLNLMGLIGVVMLTGIVVNNAIVLLDRVRQILRDAEQSADRRQAVFTAVVAAGRQRLRPILMTSLTTILALTPLAMGFGSGAELRRPMAVAVIGGLASSTLLTLWILPGLYLCVEDTLWLIGLPLRRLRRRAPEPSL